MIYSKGGSIPPIQPSNKPDYVISDEVIDATNSTEDFGEFVKTKFLKFLIENNLTEGIISNKYGEKAIVKRDKHGFYNIKITNKMTIRRVDAEE